jgi:hypothetical protein
VPTTIDRPTALCHQLLRLYFRSSALIVFFMAVLWWVGLETIYYHITPLYALYLPVLTRPWLVVVLMAALALGVEVWIRHVLPRVALAPPEGRRGAGEAAAVRRRGLVYLAGITLFLAYAAGSSTWPPTPVSLQLLRNFAAFGVFAAGITALAWVLQPGSIWARVTHKERWLLLGLVVFAFAFAGAIAMLRGGTHGIAQAYMRYETEYINDIGRGLTIRGLFRDYLQMHPYLSLHSKAHPPGPIVILWLWSYGVGRSALALSLATMATAAVAVIPLYYWVKDMLGPRSALTATALYVLMPSIVLFTATSGDILFTPLSITTLFLFWRALHRNALGYQLGAGAMYAVLSLTSFTLISLGAFFAFMGLLRLADRELRRSVFQTAFVMVAAFFAVHVGVWLWSGFDVIACFQVCLAQFQHDQLSLDLKEPRYPGWVYRFVNPFTFFIFAGIPVSLLFVGRYLRRRTPQIPILWVLLATAFVLNLLYMGRGEGERSALYIFPFLVIPAASYLQELQERVESARPLLLTAGCLAFQCWVMESLLYTYW